MLNITPHLLSMLWLLSAHYLSCFYYAICLLFVARIQQILSSHILFVFFNYIMYIQHNICSMNMKQCKKKRNHRGIMRLISNKNRSIAEIKRTRFTRFQVYRTIKRNLRIPLPPPFLPVELWNSIFVSIFFYRLSRPLLNNFTST